MKVVFMLVNLECKQCLYSSKDPIYHTSVVTVHVIECAKE